MVEYQRSAARLSGLSGQDIEELVLKLAKEGRYPSEIGIVLRDQYGVPDVKKATGKSITQILSARGMGPSLPEDLASLIRKAAALHKHLEENKKDQSSRRSLEVVEARIQKLAKYYVKKGKLPKGWRYELEKATLLIR
jgi:small subunit ribosomal protein S15